MNDIANTNDGGVSNLACGSFTGDGTDVQVTCGFLPRVIKVINMTDKTTYELTIDMQAGHALKQVAAGTLTDDNAGILFKGNADGYRGFFIPAAINLAGKAFVYYAFG